MIRYIDFTEKLPYGAHTRYQHYNVDDAYVITQQDANLKTIDRYEVSAEAFTKLVIAAMSRHLSDALNSR